MTQNSPGFSAPELPKFYNPDTFANYTPPTMTFNEHKQSMETLTAQAKNAPVNSPLYKFGRLWEHNNPSGNGPIIGSWMYQDSNTQVEESVIITQKPEKTAPKGAVYVVIDYSNLTAGLQTTADHPINPVGLNKFLLGDRKLFKGVISASFPEPAHPIWNEWRGLEYGVRVAAGGKEMFVDDSLHAQVFRGLLGQKDAHTLIMLTGDGNANSNYSSFLECAIFSADRGWNVEVCSWKQRLNKDYLSLAATYPNIKIRYLEAGKFQILGGQ